MDTISVATFVEENLKTIFAYALSRVSNHEDAEDLTGDIVIAILQSADKLKTPEAFYGYIWGIAANTYRKFLRKRSNRKSVEESIEQIEESASMKLAAEGDFAEELADAEELHKDMARLRMEIALLSKEHRECTVAYYFEELSCSAIAKKLDISPEMVKYYLFKTRKILKEGISMEREFGEKSFRPEPFEFATIFQGSFNREYQNLFTRKLPGQILLSAYYTPMSIRELAIELGVASVYLEDEISLLEKYKLLSRLATGKYQTNLVIFTEDFTKEFHREAKKLAVPALKEIFTGVKVHMQEVKSINRVCDGLSKERLLWGLLWPLMRMGLKSFSAKHPQYEEMNEIYQGVGGINYGVAGNEIPEEFRCDSFAGYAEIDENYYAMAADFGVLPTKNRYFGRENREEVREKIYKTVAGEIETEFMVLTEEEERVLGEILSREAEMMAELYEHLFEGACNIMKQHAPKQVKEEVERIIYHTLLFRTTGLFGGCAVQSGELEIPKVDGAVAVLIRGKK